MSLGYCVISGLLLNHSLNYFNIETERTEAIVAADHRWVLVLCHQVFIDRLADGCDSYLVHFVLIIVPAQRECSCSPITSFITLSVRFANLIKNQIFSYICIEYYDDLRKTRLLLKFIVLRISAILFYVHFFSHIITTFLPFMIYNPFDGFSTFTPFSE